MLGSVSAVYGAWTAVPNPSNKTLASIQNPDIKRVLYVAIGSAAPAATATPYDTDGVLELNPTVSEDYLLASGDTIYLRTASPLGANKTHRIPFGLA